MSTSTTGLGSDLVAVARIVRMVQRDPALFCQRILGAQERAAFSPQCDFRRYALHVAVKEAAFKALGTGLIGDMRWTDVELLCKQEKFDVRHAWVEMHGASLIRQKEMGADLLRFSCALSDRYAMACVMLS